MKKSNVIDVDNVSLGPAFRRGTQSSSISSIGVTKPGFVNRRAPNVYLKNSYPSGFFAKNLKDQPYNVSANRSLSPTLTLDDSIEFETKKDNMYDDSRPTTGEKKVVIPSVMVDRTMGYSFHSWTRGGNDDDVLSVGSNEDPFADTAGPYFTNDKLNERKRNEISPTSRRGKKMSEERYQVYNVKDDGSRDLGASLIVNKKPLASSNNEGNHKMRGGGKVYNMPVPLPNMITPDMPNFNPYNDIALMDYGGWIQNQLQKGVIGKPSSPSGVANQRMGRTLSAPALKTPKPQSPQPNLYDDSVSTSPTSQVKAFYSMFEGGEGMGGADLAEQSIHSFNDSMVESMASFKSRQRAIHGSPPSPGISKSSQSSPNLSKVPDHVNHHTINVKNYHMEFLTVELFNSKDVLTSTSIVTLKNAQSMVIDPNITLDKFKKLVIEKGMDLREEMATLKLFYYNSKIKAWRPLGRKIEWDQAIIQAFESAYPLKVMFSFELDEFAFLDADIPFNTKTNTNTTQWLNTRTKTGSSLSDSDSSFSRGSLDYLRPPRTSKKISSKLMSSLTLRPPKPNTSLRSLAKSLSTINVEESSSVPQYEKQQKFAKNLEQRLIKTRF